MPVMRLLEAILSGSCQGLIEFLPLEGGMLQEESNCKPSGLGFLHVRQITGS